MGFYASWLLWSQDWISTFVAGWLGFLILARHRLINPLLLAVGGVAAAFAVDGIRQADLPTPIPFVDGVLVSVAIVAATSLGDALRSREETRRVRQEAQARLIEEVRRRAAADERALIARELHDVVAHSVSVIALQAEHAIHTTPGLSPPARDRFQQIATAARSSLTELRQLLTLWHSGRTAGRADLVPQPSLADLDQLLVAHRQAGGSVTLHTTGEPGDLPGTLELTAYRVVQEALANVRRHAGGAHAEIHVEHLPERLTVRIDDAGIGRAGAAANSGPANREVESGHGPGHGLAGMRERVALVGGQLSTGARTGGGYRVVAELPIRREPANSEVT